jgi:hypothetical protein
METSAKTGKNIEKAFTDLVRAVRKYKANIPSRPAVQSAPEKTKCKCTIL